MPADSQLTARPIMQIEAIVMMVQKASALDGEITPIGIGRARVRSMIASMSRSYHILMAPAPPVASAIASTATAPERRWRFARDGAAFEQEVAPSYVTNSAEAAIWHAARDGGLTQVLGYQVIDQVRSGALAVVLAEYESPAYPIHFVYPTSRLLSAKVRTLIDTAAAEDWNFTAF